MLASLSLISNIQAQDVSQLGFPDLQAQTNAYIEQGQLREAIPLLEELIERVEASKNTEITLDFPIFLLGNAHLLEYFATEQASELSKSLKWYDKLEKEYPDSPKVKDAVITKIDLLRALNRENDAIALIKRVLDGSYSFRIDAKQKSKLLKDLTKIYYNKDAWKDGLPIFQQLRNTSLSFDDQAWAAAATFEAYVAEKRLDEAMALVPVLATESEVSYLPRFNVALFKTSDIMTDRKRLGDAAILLNLIKTTDIMIEYNEARVAEKQAKIQFNTDMGRNQEATEKLKQEVRNLEAILTQLRKLPTLRNELLVRRARNYTSTARRYEAFWMFHDLMVENPDDPQTEFFTYATFFNALKLKKTDIVIQVGRAYRKQFPRGKFYSDISIKFVSALKDSGDQSEYVQIAKDFLDSHRLNEVSSDMLKLWAGHYMGISQFEAIIAQTTEWLKHKPIFEDELYYWQTISELQTGDYRKDIAQATEWLKKPIFEDGLYYWRGISELQIGDYRSAIANFTNLLNRYPRSIYSEDGLLRKGAAQFYAGDLKVTRETLYSYTEKYPQGAALDQAYYFLGEIEKLSGDFELALKHFKEADKITSRQDIHDSCAFNIGTIYENLQRYREMAANFKSYTQRFPEKGRMTDAVFQLGRAYQFLRRPNDMLALYREYIEEFVDDPSNSGVDVLIEDYNEKYNTNKATFEKTVEFLDRLENDIDFRTLIVTDRGYLFEYFYVNTDLDQTLYNRLRNHPQFGEWLVKDLSPISEVTAIYRKQLAEYPNETPETFFREHLTQMKLNKQRIGEARMLMGLYRCDVTLDPSQPYDTEFVNEVTPRILLYIADYSRADKLDFAVEVWNTLLTKYPNDDGAIVAYMRLADVSEQRDKKAAALDYLKAIETQFPGTLQLPAVILRQGELLTAMGRSDEARERYQYILRVPNWRGIVHAQALFQTGESYISEKKYAEAHGFFERTFLGYSQFSDLCARAYLADAEALLNLGTQSDAITTLTEAVEILTESASPELMAAIQAKLEALKPATPSPQS